MMKLRSRASISVVLALLTCACGDSGTGDAGPGDADAAIDVTVGPSFEIPIISPDDSMFPYQHTNEPSIAARGDVVVIAYRNRHLLAADTYETDPAEGLARQVGVAVSTDRGATYSQASLSSLGQSTSDPVVRADGDGRFWVARLGVDGSCNLDRSSPDGATWEPTVRGVNCFDKEWIAIDDAQGHVYMASARGMWKFDYDGAQLGEAIGGTGKAFAGYADAAGGHFASESAGGFAVKVWNGTGAIQLEGATIPEGPFGGEDTHRTSVSLGTTASGEQWLIRAIGTGSDTRVALRVRNLPDDLGSDIAISTPGATGFHPAAATDADGRLHVIWYESTDDRGILLYARSRSSDFTEGFHPPIVIDDAAVPVGHWYPESLHVDALRRLREYIDIAVDGDRAQLAWTRAQTPPSRVMATYVEF